MSILNRFSRRSFLAATAAAPFAAAVDRLKAADKHIPVGLELYSVRGDLGKDEAGTLRDVAKLGYQCVEFYAPYYNWTPDHAKDVRKQLDDLGLRCYSTHNDLKSFSPPGITKAIQLNNILGAHYIVMASPGKIMDIDDWKKVAETLNKANETMDAEGLNAGYHNHDLEWHPMAGQIPLEVIAKNTHPTVMLQLDVGTCLETGNDPVAWIIKNPGRIRSLHLKDWSPEKGYKVLFGEGIANWPKIFAAAEDAGGVQYYLIEQEGSAYPEIETAKRCLESFRKMQG
jgi:sugar phosphate isomerase/epimerase